MFRTSCGPPDRHKGRSRHDHDMTDAIPDWPPDDDDGVIDPDFDDDDGEGWLPLLLPNRRDDGLYWDLVQ